MKSDKTIEQVQMEHEAELMSIAGVNGVGIGECTDGPCIMIFVEVLEASLQDQLPTILDGYDTQIVEIGVVSAGDDNEVLPSIDNGSPDNELPLDQNPVEALLDIPGVVAYGDGECDDGTPCLIVFVTAVQSDSADSIKSVLGDHPYQIVESGNIGIEPEE